MISSEIVSIATVYRTSETISAIKWITDKIEPTYLDQDNLGEHLYSVDDLMEYVGTASREVVPDSVKKLLQITISNKNDIAYLRIANI